MYPTYIPNPYIINDTPCKHVMYLVLYKKTEVVTRFAIQVYDNYGDTCIKALDQNQQTDPALKIHSEVALKINHNKDLVKTWIANGTLCRRITSKLKDNQTIGWKNWDRQKVITISAKNVGYMSCEDWIDKSNQADKSAQQN